MRAALCFDPFSPLPPIAEKDILQIRELLETLKPDLLIIPYSFEESSPTQRYRALQILASGLERSELHQTATVWEVCSPFYPFGSEDGNCWEEVDKANLEALKPIFKGRCEAETHLHQPFWSALQARLTEQQNRIYFKESTVEVFLSKAKKLREGLEWL